MGLDITAYQHVRLLRAMTVQQANAEDYDPGDRAGTLLYVDHPSRTQHDGMTEGVYEVSGAEYGFRAGSYGGYNGWRAALARLIGTTDEAIWADPKLAPFVELIHFSDCEGFIGPQTSAKLAKDFAEWDERAAEALDQWELRVYRSFTKAFRLASADGAVQFH